MAHTCRVHDATFPATLTTTTLNRSSSGRFAASPRRAAAEDHGPNRVSPSISDAALHKLIVFYIDLPSVFVLTHQIEIYFSIVQRKVLTPNDFDDLAEVKQRLTAFQQLYNEIAEPFAWNFTREKLNAWLARLSAHQALAA